MDTLYKEVIANKQKAVVGFAVAAVVAYFSQHGFDLDTLTVREAVEALLWGVAGYVSVWFKKNQ